MNLNRYTQKSRDALEFAQQVAAERHHQEVTGKHLLFALANQEEGLVPRLLELMKVDMSQFSTQIESLLRGIPAVTGYDSPMYMNSGLLRVLSRAEQETKEMKYEEVRKKQLERLSEFFSLLGVEKTSTLVALYRDMNQYLQ